MQMLDFFGMEASEYLEKLDALVSGGQRPDTVEFVRLARALRGSATMASQKTIADAASALEALARGLHETSVEWGPEAAGCATRAVDDLKIAVRRLADWTADDEARIKKITDELNGLSGQSPAPDTRDPGGLDTGTRAFIGREGAAVASALQRASQTAGPGTAPSEVVDAILNAIQPLKGIASLGDAPPLPDLLDGVERIAAVCRRHPQAPISGLREILGAGAEAISEVARQVASSGRPDSDSARAADFARLLRSAFEGDGMVIPIEDLFYEDDGPNIVSRGEVPDSQTLDPVELVAHGEHLKLAADNLDNADSDTQHDLRIQALETELLTLARAAGNEVSAAVSRMARSFQNLIVTVRNRAESSRLTERLRDAAAALAEAAPTDHGSLIDRLNAIGDALATPASEAGTVEAARPMGEQIEPEPVEEVAPATRELAYATAHEEEVEQQPEVEPVATPVEPDAAAEPEAPAQPSAPRAVEETGGSDLAASFAMLESMIEASTSMEPSIGELLAGPPEVQPAAVVAEPEAAPAAAAEPAPEPEEAPVSMEPEPAGVVAETEPETPVEQEAPPIEEFLAPVTDFCYSGQRALEHALSLGDSVRNAIEDGDAQNARDLIDEVLDLIELGIGSAEN